MIPMENFEFTARERQLYSSPAVILTDMSPEGVLCFSAKTEEYVYNEVEW